MKRLNITLPDSLNRSLETMNNKSHYIAEAVKEKLEREKIQKLEEQLIEGYKATREEDKKLNMDWENITIENWQHQK
jgi:metal-responsive CopG/Arc/MetJ family transcriptional regulator